MSMEKHRKMRILLALVTIIVPMMLTFTRNFLLGMLFSSILVIVAWMMGKGPFLEDKKMIQTQIWIWLPCFIAFGFLIGRSSGDYVAGLGSAIALSFVGVFRLEVFFDERMSIIFSKASRNAFIVLNVAFAFVVLGDVYILETPILNQISPRDSVVAAIVLSWLVFLASWFYYKNMKGE